MSNIDQEFLDELRQDMMDEYAAEQREEMLYRSDYGALFDNEVSPLLDEIEDLLENIKNLHEAYGWEFEMTQFIKDNL